MSDAHDAHAADAHGADAHHDFDAEPARELSPGEPRTPGWVPALGLALFMGAGLVFLLRGADDSAAPEGKPATTASPPAAAPPAAPQRAIPGAGQARPVPPPQGSQPNLQRLSPEQIQQIRQRVQERQQQPGGAGAPGAPGAAPPPPRPAPAPAH
jgi:hypothetical protein